MNDISSIIFQDLKIQSICIKKDIKNNPRNNSRNLVKSYIRNNDLRKLKFQHLRDHYMFVYAAEYKKYDIMAYMISNGVESKLVTINTLIETKNIKLIKLFLKYHPLMVNLMMVSALQHNFIQLVKLLLHSWRVIRYKKITVYGCCQVTSYNTIKYLILNIKDAISRTDKKIAEHLFGLAIKQKNSRFVEFVLDNFDIDLNFNRDLLISNISGFCNKNLIRRILKDPKINPSARRNEAIHNAFIAKRYKNIKILLKDPRLIPNNIMTKAAAICTDVNMLTYLLSYPGLDPAEHDNDPIIHAAACWNIKAVKLLLADTRVDPTARANRAIYDVLTPIETDNEMVELLLSDTRIKNSVDYTRLLQLAKTQKTISIIEKAKLEMKK
jgi:hypothetical protein